MIKDRNISGMIRGDQVWSGTVRVTGDIYADPGDNATVTILPDTVVIISAHGDDTGSGLGKYDWWGEKHGDPTISDDYSKTHIELNARIRAHGTPGHPILFTSDRKETAYDYEDLGLFDGSVLDYTTVEYARSGIACNGDNIVIMNSTVRHVLWGGIAANSHNPVLVNNDISDCGHEGIDIQPGGNATIADSTISRSAVGVMVITGGNAAVRDTQFIENGIAIGSDKGPGCPACLTENITIVPLEPGDVLTWSVDGKMVYRADSESQK